MEPSNLSSFLFASLACDGFIRKQVYYFGFQYSQNCNFLPNLIKFVHLDKTNSMRSKEIRITYEEFERSEIDDKGIQELLTKAEKAADQAYAPFSGFHVGVAIELANGLIFSANNQENKAYPSGLCAERVGLFFVQANYPDTPIRRMMLVAKYNQEVTDEPVFPCGACRQVMVESAERQETPYELWMAGKNRILRIDSPDHLLPLKFLL
jgi:cytidine deaminase